MSDNVIPFTGPFYGHIDPERVLEGAKEARLLEVIVVGEEEDGSLYIAFSSGVLEDSIAMLERAKYKLIKAMDEEDIEQ
jgi:hypothetical protein